MVTGSRSLFLIIVGAAFAMPVSATSPIYRCVKAGQTVLTDKPCDATVTAASTATAAPSSGVVGKQTSAPESIVGEWRGQTQFQAAENGQLIEVAHSVVPLTLTFSADGKVSGKSADNGCELLGLWAPGVTPRMFTLDITLKNCEYGGNRGSRSWAHRQEIRRRGDVAAVSSLSREEGAPIRTALQWTRAQRHC